MREGHGSLEDPLGVRGTFALDVNSETVGGKGGRYYSARVGGLGGSDRGWGMQEFPCANREEA